MTDTNKVLDATDYRRFGLVSSAIVVLLFGLAIPWLFSLNFPGWPWVFAAVLGGWALLLPLTLKPVYTAWMKFGDIMNWINTRLILGIVFYGLVLPTGIIMRLFGNDPMRRKLDSAASSYRVPSSNEGKDNMEHPY